MLPMQQSYIQYHMFYNAPRLMHCYVPACIHADLQNTPATPYLVGVGRFAVGDSCDSPEAASSPDSSSESACSSSEAF